ncbi:MAG: threonine synthase [bacterium]|nr:threonine synthase [bacterium]
MEYEPLQAPYKGILNRYWNRMPADMQSVGKDKIVTLGEGATRLWRARRLEEYIDDTYGNFRAKVYLKLEGDNRGTGSFKDRGMTAAVTMAAAHGKKIGICASTGNTAAAVVAYCHAVGMRSIVIMPYGAVAPGKLFQSKLHNTKAIQIRGNFDDALDIVKEVVVQNSDIELLNSLNTYRMEGQKTASFEIVDELSLLDGPSAPHYHFIPVGNGGNITAYWKGYKEYYDGVPKRLNNLPKMMGYQAAGSAPIVLGKVVKEPKTIASAIRIGNPAKWTEAEAAIRESHGKIDSVTDKEIMAAYELLPKLEPVSCEPSSATALAGLLKAAGEPRSENYFGMGSVIVCTLTGSIFKDLKTAQKVFMKEPPIVIDASYDAVMDIVRSK